MTNRYKTGRNVKRCVRWWTAPFRTEVHIHERTRIEHRRFPYKLRVQRIESIQDKLNRIAANGDNLARLEGQATILVTDTIHVPSGITVI